MGDAIQEPLFASAVTVQLRYADRQPALFVNDEAVQLEALGAALLHRSDQRSCLLEVLVYTSETDTPADRAAFLAYIRAAQLIFRQHHFNSIHYRTL